MYTDYEISKDAFLKVRLNPEGKKACCLCPEKTFPAWGLFNKDFVMKDCDLV